MTIQYVNERLHIHDSRVIISQHLLMTNYIITKERVNAIYIILTGLNPLEIRNTTSHGWRLCASYLCLKKVSSNSQAEVSDSLKTINEMLTV